MIFENPYKVSGDAKKIFMGPLESFELIRVNFILKCKLLHVPVKNFLVELCHALALGIHQTYQKSSFFMTHLTFYNQHRGSQTPLFYSKRKVWIFPEILSPFPAPYDKNLLLWLLANFSKKWDFPNSSKCMKSFQNLISSKSLWGDTDASFWRTELFRKDPHLMFLIK